jgi:hypothetical protein
MGDRASGNAHTTNFQANLGTGHWRHVTFLGDRFDGRISVLGCHSNTGDIADIEGTGSFRGSAAILTFFGHIEDRTRLGESDVYSIALYNGTTLVYSTGGAAVVGDFGVTISAWAPRITLRSERTVGERANVRSGSEGGGPECGGLPGDMFQLVPLGRLSRNGGSREEANMLGRRGRRPSGDSRGLVLRSATVAAVASLAVMVVPAMAAADPPVRQEITLELTGPHFLSGICGITISQEGTAQVSTTLFDDGRVTEHIEVDLELTANGMVAFEQPRFTVVVEPAAATVTLTGTLVNIHAPAEGQLLVEVGRVVTDMISGDPLFSAGRFMIREGEVGRVCAFFGAGQ